jgi:hypothetical protein
MPFRCSTEQPSKLVVEVVLYVVSGVDRRSGHSLDVTFRSETRAQLRHLVAARLAGGLRVEDVDRDQFGGVGLAHDVSVISDSLWELIAVLMPSSAADFGVDLEKNELARP